MWTQLMLQPSPSRHAVLRPGAFRLNVGHAGTKELHERQTSGRMLAQKVATADARPPDGVPTVSLHSVELCMDLLEPRSSLRLTGKRARLCTREMSVTQPEPEMCFGEDRGEARAGCIQPTPDLRSSQKDDAPTSGLQTSTRKRRLGMADQPLVASGRKVGRRHEESALIDSLVEGAIRITICGSLSKPANGSRVRANTFHQSLSDIAPSLWKPGFAQVQRPPLKVVLC